MARRRVPPELRRRTWAEGSVWDLLVAADLLPYRFASPLADLGMTSTQRRRQRREEEQLKTTQVAYILPRPSTARRPPQPWLYLRMKRTGHYRVGESGAIERFGRRTQSLGSGSISEHRWYPCSLRGVRWLQIVADGRIVRKVRANQQEPLSPAADVRAPEASDQAQGSPQNVVQLTLFASSQSEAEGQAQPVSC
ncbi:MAG: hypothetical protein HGA45_28725 [Chloroflexales bacterium]|nr:hypothetical protein [Chloroflexales bacterium]